MSKKTSLALEKNLYFVYLYLELWIYVKGHLFF